MSADNKCAIAIVKAGLDYVNVPMNPMSCYGDDLNTISWDR